MHLLPALLTLVYFHQGTYAEIATSKAPVGGCSATQDPVKDPRGVLTLPIEQGTTEIAFATVENCSTQKKGIKEHGGIVCSCEAPGESRKDLTTYRIISTGDTFTALLAALDASIGGTSSANVQVLTKALKAQVVCRKIQILENERAKISAPWVPYINGNLTTVFPLDDIILQLFTGLRSDSIGHRY